MSPAIKLSTNVILAVFVSLFVFGCRSIPMVSTNLDKENFERYYAPSSVKMYETEQSLPNERHYLGLVEGDSCQIKPNDAPANDADARTDARRKAASKKADAIVFTTCVAIKDNQCISSRVCYGKAFKLISK